MNFKFKNYKLSDADRIWLTEIYEKRYSKTDISIIKVKLWGKLPENFDPKKIDTRLFNNFGLTLVGLWHIDPNNKLFNVSDKILNATKQIIQENPSIDRLKATQLVEKINEPLEDIEIAFRLIYSLHFFFGSASGISEKGGYLEVGFRRDESKFDNILRFKNIEKSIEDYFLKMEPSKEAIVQVPKKRTSKNPDQKIWVDIEYEYGFSKRRFGKKINFVKDRFKREIIFRDVSQAFELAYDGFSKPSVILSGSVIEELLRLYLAQNKIVPTTNTFDGYIKSCEENGLIKKGISRLSESLRHFRNLVHLSREKSSRSSISKATAKGSVASIFTIINDF